MVSSSSGVARLAKGWDAARMDCLLCHRKIPHWRRLKTGSDFCSDEHLEQHKRETFGRLMEYREPSPSHSAEDPIHRLDLMDKGVLAHDQPRREWQLRPFVAVEVRRYSLGRTRQ